MRKDQFERITKWQLETFPNATAQSKLIHLQEEVKELFEAIDLQMSDDMVRLEFADCFTLLFGAAKAYGLSYSDCVDCIELKSEINLNRKWGTPDENGVVKHIKE
jgi:NTP pyrophosphatase (non-canonical NTP hydrolase)